MKRFFFFFCPVSFWYHFKYEVQDSFFIFQTRDVTIATVVCCDPTATPYSNTDNIVEHFHVFAFGFGWGPISRGKKKRLSQLFLTGV